MKSVVGGELEHPALGMADAVDTHTRRGLGHYDNNVMNEIFTARPGCWSGWISDSYYSLKPLWSGMGEVVPVRTSPPLHPPSPPTVL